MLDHLDLRQTLMVCAGGWLVVLHVISSLRDGTLQYCARLLRNAVSLALGWIVSWSRQCSLQDVDETRDEVLRLMHERQAQRMKACAMVFSNVFCLHSVGVFINEVSGKPHWMTFEQNVVVMLFFSLSLVMNTGKKFERESMVLAYYSLAMLSVTALVWVGNDFPIGEGEVMLYTGIASCMGRLIASLSVLHLSSAVLWNIICSVSFCFKAGLFLTRHGDSFWTFCFSELAVCCAIVILSANIHFRIYAEVEHEVIAACGSIEKSAVTMLLDNICDVVLPLDSNLAIAEEVPRFKSMLMLRPEKTVRGLQMNSFLSCEEDAQRFNRHLTTSDSAGLIPESAVRCFNVTIRDSDGNSIDVEVFSVKFEKFNKSTHYMLGIREIVDSKVHPTPLNVKQSCRAEDARSSRRGTRAVQRMAVSQPSVIGNAEELSSFSAPSNSSSGGMCCCFPALVETSNMARIATLLHLMGTWNSRLPRRSCCTMHASTREVKHTLKEMLRMPCMRNLHVGTQQGCRACGILDHHDNDNDFSCRVCGYDARIRL
eukprot:TRINITY_DN29196_c0_g1_i1.p1 TRINITY_DN29196_c0_g1~~TRINITY_DN29196_c0_g1_i1.p1  ORF type:complete len:541 (-),score=45.92 TRINITY_DN29196_c0_g1_i1:148-1770(-)